MAGTGAFGFSGDGGPAVRATFTVPRGLAVGPDGSLYITDDRRVRRVTPDGLVRTVAGNGIDDFSHQGLPATQSPISFLRSVKVAPDGTLYIGADEEVFIVTPNGILNSLAGFRFAGVAGDGGPARAARFAGVTEMALTQTGDLLIADPNHHEVRRIAAPMPGTSLTGYAIASEDGRELYGFDASGRHLVTRDATTGVSKFTFAYDANGRMSAVTDAQGRATRVERDAGGNPTAVVAPDGEREAFTVDSNGELATLTGPDGHPVQFQSLSSGLLGSVTDATGNIVYRYAYDTAGRLKSVTNRFGGVTTSTEQLGLGNTQLSIFSPTGQPLSLTSAQLASGAQSINLVGAGGARLQTTVGPDSQTVIVAPDGTTTTMTGAADPRYGMQSPVGTETVKLPSGLTRTTRVRRGIGLTDTEDPFSFNIEVDSTVVNGRVSLKRFDRSVNVVTSTSPAGVTLTSQLDALGRMVSMVGGGALPTTQVFDGLGRVSEMRFGGRRTTYTYDAFDRVNAMTDAQGQVQSFIYDGAGRVTERRMPNGRVVRFSYDATGNLTSVTPPNRPAHTLVYNDAGALSTYTAPDAGDGAPVLRFTYDSAGRAKSIVKPDGTTVFMTYDVASFSQKLALGLSDTLTLTRDGATGHLTRETLTSGVSLVHTYDGALPTSTTWSGAVQGTVSRTFDADFRVLSDQLTGGTAIGRAYNFDGQLVSAGALTITRDTTSGMPAASTLGIVRTGENYVAGPELKSTVVIAGTDTLLASSFERDSLGRITQRTEKIAGVVTMLRFSYDSTGRLISVVKDGTAVEVYEYDTNGNRIRATTSAGSVTGTIDVQDRLTAYGTTRFEYSANGEVLKKLVGTDTTAFTYDAMGTLRSVRQPGGTVVDYVIDAEGRRVGKKVNGLLVASWLYDGSLAILGEYDASGSLVSRFVYGERRNVPEYMVRGGVTYRFVLDERGSVRLVLNTTDGLIAQRLTYDAFGRISENSNPGFQPFAFAGGQYDQTTGLAHFGAREYDPETGRWLSKDPLGFVAGDVNLYAYAFGDPINFTDVEGLEGSSADLEGAMSIDGINRRMQLPIKVFRLALQKTGCYALEQVIQQEVFGLISNVVYDVTLGAGDLLTPAMGDVSRRYIGRTVGELAKRFQGHHRQLDKLVRLIVPGEGQALADVEATMLHNLSTSLESQNWEAALQAGKIGNLRAPGGGKILPMCP